VEASGKAAVAVFTSQFEKLAHTLAASSGRPDLRVLALPYPLDTRPEAEVRDIARASFADLLRVLGYTDEHQPGQ
jgi:hypothetical protein